MNNKLTKREAIEIATTGSQAYADVIRMGHGDAKAEQFLAGVMPVIAKGENLSEEFFASLEYNIYDSMIDKGRKIARAIHAATA